MPLNRNGPQTVAVLRPHLPSLLFLGVVGWRGWHLGGARSSCAGKASRNWRPNPNQLYRSASSEVSVPIGLRGVQALVDVVRYDDNGAHRFSHLLLRGAVSVPCYISPAKSHQHYMCRRLYTLFNGLSYARPAYAAKMASAALVHRIGIYNGWASVVSKRSKALLFCVELKFNRHTIAFAVLSEDRQASREAWMRYDESKYLSAAINKLIKSEVCTTMSNVRSDVTKDRPDHTSF
jgi:hypothetical protein